MQYQSIKVTDLDALVTRIEESRKIGDKDAFYKARSELVEVFESIEDIGTELYDDYRHFQFEEF